MADAPFILSFYPANDAVKLLADIAADSSSPHKDRAADVLLHWQSSLATPEQIARVQTNDDLEVDDHGAAVSEGDGGYWVQAWVWVPTDGEDDF